MPVASIICWGTTVLGGAIAAARFVEGGGGAVDLVDLRTLMPFDCEAIAVSVRETNRVIVVTEEPDFSSFGRHIHSWIGQELHYDLDPVPLLISAVAAPGCARWGR